MSLFISVKAAMYYISQLYELGEKRLNSDINKIYSEYNNADENKLSEYKFLFSSI